MTAIESFKNLHIPGDPLLLFNIWDAGSAKAVADAGAKAIATGSYGVAQAQGFADGEGFPLSAVLSNLERIASVTDLPISIDMESGYGSSPEQVTESVRAAMKAGAAGINLEDRMPGLDALTPIEDQTARIAAAAKTGLFVNARCDVFRGQPAETHGPELNEQVAERARAYADAGAGGLFVPFTTNRACIAAICEASPIPVNIIWTPASEGGFSNPSELAELGVARISHGHRPWAAAMAWLSGEAKSVFAGSTPSYDTV
ncbi:isocitrate lyase/phosphoenolpyruvate mutase family protein [Pontixanthobacter aestiaquae]|uniref:Isocitrate lyase/phosphoenolpyruvate mutase family protein n=1 Tax=Pontixanthobacter aestiaquae TaxID=1509367 RepID=A0A844Z8E5_9SPHN|nr:isocitrate lyase/phosphoenolpyruvate mutase family protein [Pontixanthobacter aestiaquae]MDN3644911.1 isocitrate lyase/phosphoenolpyruvate mutase family protein [Pontixanthobacter aestiaquae]MXO84088.1 isocitrate lyase/phosphoenolpyruvate mutase family protein [Pontixanthobacter aestiaquae]